MTAFHSLCSRSSSPSPRSTGGEILWGDHDRLGHAGDGDQIIWGTLGADDGEYVVWGS